MKVSMKATLFREAAKAALVATAKDKAILALRGVLIEWGGRDHSDVGLLGSVRFVATDRYRLAALSGFVHSFDGEGSVLLDRSDVQGVVRQIPATAGEMLLDIDVLDGGMVRVSGRYGMEVQWSLSLTPIGAGFPQWRTLVDRADSRVTDGDGDMEASFNLKYVADVGSMPGKLGSLRMAGPTAASTWRGETGDTLGDVSWLYLLMPVRSDSK